MRGTTAVTSSGNPGTDQQQHRNRRPPSQTLNRGETGQGETPQLQENRELEQLDTNLPLWEARKDELESLLATGGSDYAALEALSEELSTLLQTIASGEERWLELSEMPG